MTVHVYVCVHVTARISADVFASARGFLTVRVGVFVCECITLVTTLSLLPPYIISPKDF